MDCSLLRNIGIIAHIDAGKTTFSERILFYSDVIHRMGEVHEGAATMDFMPEEQERGITIASACITCLWRGHTINLVDTPGHVDFTVEVERCLRVLDAAVGIFCAVGGVEPQSETVWRQADDFGIPRLAVVNKMDRPGASFSMVLEAMRRRLGANPLAVTIPLGEGEDFHGVLDLVRRERLIFDSASKGKLIERAPFTPEEAILAAPWRETLMDALTMEDDALLTQYLSGEEPAPEALDAALRNFSAEDPTLAVEMNEATGQRVVSGMGELQLEVLVDRMRRECGVSPRVGNPQVVCRETIGSAAEAQGEFDRELGGQAHYGLVTARVAPRERASGIHMSFAPDAYAPGEWHPSLLEAAEQGVYDACYSGPNGYAVEDVEVIVLGIGRKQGLATAPGMHMAAQQAVRAALEKAKSLVLEPLMQVDITVPENFLGSVIALLGARGARIEGLDDKAGQKHIHALAPMRGLFGFATALRSASQGRAGLMMQFVRFDAV